MELGKTYRDPITGLTGMATARCIYLHGTTQIQIEPGLNHQGEHQDSVWFNESRLVEVAPGTDEE